MVLFASLYVFVLPNSKINIKMAVYGNEHRVSFDIEGCDPKPKLRKLGGV